MKEICCLKIVLKKTAKQVISEQKKPKTVDKSKGTKTVDVGHLYPNPAEEEKRKLDKLKKNK